MRSAFVITSSIALLSVVVLSAPQILIAHARATEASMDTSAIQIPASVATEHEEIHSTLVAATKAPGRVGAAARELAEVLHPHFVREEQIALPPLGLLEPLAAGNELPDGVASQVLAMTDALQSELPSMMEEHKVIRAAVEKLRLAARAEHAPEFERLAEQLALHAQTEEEVLYPAAIMVGEIIRGRAQKK